MNIRQTAVDIPTAEWPRRWPQVRLNEFRRIEFVTVDTLDLLNTMCRDAEFKRSWQHRINSDYRAGTSGLHPMGRAIDIVFFDMTPGDVPVDEQFRFARQYPWGGIGVYPYWHAPGLHVDSRQGLDHIALWWQDKDKSYRAMAEYERRFGVALV